MNGDEPITYVHVPGIGMADKALFYDSAGHSQSSHNLAMSGSRAVFTPDHSRLIVWSEVSRVQVYSVNPFMLEYTYSGSQTSLLQANRTQNIEVSADSQRAVIETDS